jgi:hypothetical protein
MKEQQLLDKIRQFVKKRYADSTIKKLVSIPLKGAPNW